MDSNIILHVFSCLQRLEKRFAFIKSVAPYSAHFEKYSSLIPQQTEILAHMRRTANLLQLEFAKKQWELVSHSLKIFYGLHQMIRPELQDAFNAVSNNPENLAPAQKITEKQLMLH